MRQSGSRQLFDYWDRIRAGRPAPRREEIEPSDIRNLLSDTFILEVSGRLKTVSYRLAGTRLCAAFGRELKGYGFLGHWAEEDCFEVAKLLTRVYQSFEPLVVVMRAETERGKIADYEFILLPLEPMADGTARILGIATPSKDFYWLGAEPLTNCKLRSMRSLRDENMKGSYAPPLAPSLSPITPLEGEGEPKVFIPTGSDGSGTGTSRKVAHLMVHDGGKSDL